MRYNYCIGNDCYHIVTLTQEIEMLHKNYPVDEWAKLYGEGMSSTKIAKLYNNSPSTILKYVKGIVDIRPAKFDSGNYTECREAYHFFDTIDTEEKAYWLGFIYADGSLSKNGNRLLIYLSSQDSEHLRKLASIFGREVIVGRHGKYSRAMLTVHSTHIWKQLNSKGIHPGKTYIDKPEVMGYVPSDLVRHFIRGNFDGDGCISIENGSYRVDMIAHKSVITIIRDIVAREAGVRTNPIVQNKVSPIVHHVMWCGSAQVNNIHRYMYTDATVYMERKYDKFGEVLCTIRGKSKHIGITECGSRWKAMVYHDGLQDYLGLYDTKIEASRARDRYIIGKRIKNQILSYC